MKNNPFNHFSPPWLGWLKFLAALLFVVFVSSCTTTPPALTASPTLPASSATPLPTDIPTALPTFTPTPSPSPTPSPIPTATPLPSPTPTVSPLLVSKINLDRQNAASIRQQTQWGLGAIRSQVPLQDGKLILVTTEQGMLLYAAETLSLVQAFPGAGQARFSDDGRYMVYSDSSRIAVYDLANTRPYQTLPGSAVMMATAFSPDNQLLAVVHSSTEIDIIRLEDLNVTPLTRARTSQNEPSTYRAAFSPDNTQLLTNESGGLVMWNIPEKKVTWYLKNTNKYIPQKPFSPDGRFFLAHDNKGSSLHDSRFATELFSALGSPTDSSFSPDGKLFVLVNKQVVTIYTLNQSPGVVRILMVEGPGKIYFSPDSSKLSAGSKVLNLDDFTTQLVESAPAKLGQISPAQALQLGHFSNLKGFAAGNQGELWVWGVQDRQIFRWETVSGRLQTIEIVGSQFMANIAYHAESERFAACTDKGLEVLSLKDNSRKLFPACVISGQVAFAPDGYQIARASLTTIDILDANDGSVIRKLIEHTVNINQLVFSADDKWLAVGTFKNQQNGYCQVSLWQLDPLRLVTGFRGKLIPGGVMGLAVTPDGQWLLGLTNMLRVWRTADSEQMKFADLQGTNLALAPGGSLAATSGGGKINLWSVPELEPLATLPGEPDEIVSLGFTADGANLVSLGKEGVVRLWAAP